MTATQKSALLLLFTACSVLGGWLWTPDKSREELEATYLASPNDLREVDGTRLHVRDSGLRSGPALVLIHGLGSQLQTWDGWAKALQDEFRVIRFDLPGSGLSMPEANPDYSDERADKLLLALLAQLNVDTVVLIGNSIGGRLAWRFAANHPQRVAGLVLVSPDGFASPGFEYGQTPEIPVVMNVMKHVLPKTLLRSNLAAAYSDPDALSDTTLQRYHDLLLAPGGREALLERMRQTILEPPEPILSRIKAPVLLLWGTDDQFIPISNAADYEQSLEDVRLVALPGLGHVPQEEGPVTSVAPVIEFLRGL